MHDIAIISPHFDDAAFSLGALLAGGERDCVIVTVCGGVPESLVPSSWDARCGFTSAAQAGRQRQKEDLSACAVASARPVHLPFVDLPYSGKKDTALLIDSLRDLVDSADVLVAPLGIGGHPDHSATRDAILRLARERPIKLWLYADLPYAAARGWDTPDDQRDERFRWRPAFDSVEAAGFALGPACVQPLDQGAMEAKLSVVRCYESQIRPLQGLYPRLIEPTGPLATECSWPCTLQPDTDAEAPSEIRSDDF